ncbi:MAG: aspartate--tRNA ligase [Bdellovibrionota bacterium]|nr:MAG: aspartate--tRNA ligase [Bdellovibrionota bacterium]
MSSQSAEFLRSKYRSHTCGELRQGDVGTEVRLAGWVHRKRDHGGVVFIDLRDHYGLTQLVFHGEQQTAVQELRTESVIGIEGKVVARDAQQVNAKLPTGHIEISVSKVEVLSAADVIPFQVAEDDGAPEAQRLRYRFLELRRENLHRNIILRAKVIRAMRGLMEEMGFNEFQTPILTSSSPEGARDFIVPSRLHPGKFYALPQAPQQFKQLLMVSGFDRYFQIAPCFRDEDARADRSPGEFYQLDMELSFVTHEEVFKVNERLLHQLFSSLGEGEVSKPPFLRIPYKQAIERYGTDKPDLRNPLVIEDASSIFQNTGFKVFKEALDMGGKVYALAAKRPDSPSRKYFDDTVDFFTKHLGKPVAYLFIDQQGAKGSIAKFVTSEEVSALRAKYLNGDSGVVFLAAGNQPELHGALGKLRDKIGSDFDLTEKNAFRFCWITDFPFYERNSETGQVEFGHNPFSMPQGGLDALLHKKPLEILAHQYDVVCNGYEIASGAIRNHSPEIMYKAFEIVGYDRSHVDEKFGGMVRAFKFGAPPHGGIAFGIERIVMLLAAEEAIREVIAFPLNQNGEDLLMQAPSTVTEKQLKDVHIQLRPNAAQR